MEIKGRHAEMKGKVGKEEGEEGCLGRSRDGKRTETDVVGQIMSVLLSMPIYNYLKCIIEFKQSC